MESNIIITHINEKDYEFSPLEKLCMGFMGMIYTTIIVGGLMIYTKLDHSNDRATPLFIMMYVMTGLGEIYCAYITRQKYLNYEKVRFNLRNFFIMQTVLNHITLFATSIVSYSYPKMLSPYNVSNIFICVSLAEIIMIPFMILFVCGGSCYIGYESLLSWCLKGIDRDEFSDTDSDTDSPINGFLNLVPRNTMYSSDKPLPEELIV